MDTLSNTRSKYQVPNIWLDLDFDRSDFCYYSKKFELKLIRSNCFKSHKLICNKSKQEPQLMLTNPRDTFRGQSRSPNTVPIDMLFFLLACNIVTLSVTRTVFEIFGFKTAVTLKPS